MLLYLSTLWLLTVKAQPSTDCPLDLTGYIQRYPRQARELSEVHDPLGIIPKSHAGFITVDEALGNHLFFWFFPAINEDPKAPLLVWLNGGPTESSMMGLLHENGPIRLTVTSGSVGYERWNRSWAETLSMLYIDNPVGTGFSYTDSEDGYRLDQDGYAQDLYSFIVQFYKMFPEYYSREFYIGGESYAGKYVPAFAYLLDQKIRSGKANIKLTGIYMGAPFYDPFQQIKSAPDLLFNLGVISGSQKAEYVKNITDLENRLSDPSSTVNIFEIFSTFRPPLGPTDFDNYDTQIPRPAAAVQALMNTPGIKSAVHAGNRTFLVFNFELFAKLTKDFVTSATDKLASLMNKYKVLIYGGDYDITVSTAMLERALATTSWAQRQEYLASSRTTWQVNSELAGYYTRVGKFCRVGLRHSGHSAPFDQPDNTALMMQEFINKGCVG